MVRFGNFLFHWRNGLFPIIVALVILLPGPAITPDPLGAVLLGAVVAFLGQFVRASTIGLEYIIRGGKNRRVYAEKLVTEGVYSHSRNPMYVGNLLILAGVVIASNSWTAAILGIALGLITYRAIVAAEEDFLRNKFGPGFDEYCSEVPRFWPRLAGLSDTFSNSTFHWRRLIVKEYGTPFGWISALCAIACWHLYRDGGFAGDEAKLRLIGLIFAVTLAGWLTARVLKKRRSMVAD
jgi:protein-S-isoprenylcysteine O-methyltransferase Ste14